MNDGHPHDVAGVSVQVDGLESAPLVRPADGVRLMTEAVKRLKAELAIAQSHLFFNPNDNFAARKREVEQLAQSLELAQAQLADFQKLAEHEAPQKQSA